MYTRISDLLEQANLLSVHQLSVYHSLLQYFKIRKQKQPEYLYNRIMNIDKEPKQPMRLAKQVSREKQNSWTLDIMKNSFICRTKAYWLQLPPDLRNSSGKIDSVKVQLKKWVKDNVPILQECQEVE